jgi:hypothetical protein
MSNAFKCSTLYAQQVDLKKINNLSSRALKYDASLGRDEAMVAASEHVLTEVKSDYAKHIDSINEAYKNSPWYKEVEQSVIEEPKAEEPVVEEPKAEEPVVEAPKAEEPVVEEPKAGEPVVEEPVAEEVKPEFDAEKDLDSIESETDATTGEKHVTIYGKEDGKMQFWVDSTGNISDATLWSFSNGPLSDVIGKEYVDKIMAEDKFIATFGDNTEAPKFSISSDIQEAVDRALSNHDDHEVMKTVVDKFDSLSDVAKNNIYAVVTQRQLADIGKKGLTDIPKYIAETTQMNKTQETSMQVSDKIAKKWEQLVEHSEVPFVDKTRKAHNKVMMKKTANVMHFATIYGQDPREAYSGKANDLEARSNHAYVTQLYNGLNDKAREVFSEVANDHQVHLQKVIAAEIANVEATKVSREAKDALITELKALGENNKIYFNLARFGKYTMYYREAAGGEKIFKMFETQNAQERFVRSNPGIEVIRKGAIMEELPAIDGVSREFFGKVKDLTSQISDEAERSKLQDAMAQIYLKSLPDMSSRKAFIHRNKTPGFEADALRAYANKAFHDAKLIARLQHSNKLEGYLDNMRKAVEAAMDTEGNPAASKQKAITDSLELMKALRDEASSPIDESTEGHELREEYRSRETDPVKRKELLKKDITDLENIKSMADKMRDDPIKYQRILAELRLSHAAAMNSTTAPLTSFLNSLGFFMYLGFSPSAAIINGLQTPTMAMPYMESRFGFAKANAALLRNVKQFFTGNDGEGHLSISSKLDAPGQELRRKAFNEFLDRGIFTLTQTMDLSGLADEGINAGSTRRKVTYATGYLFQRTENFNREVTGMAAFDLEYAHNKNLPEEERFNKAVEYADEVINTAHGDYRSANRARFMRGNVARVITQFKAYPQFVLYNWGKATLEAIGVAKKKASGIPLTAEDKQAVKLLGYMVVSQGAVAGLMGLPIGGFMVVAQMIANAVGDPDDPDNDVEDELKAFIYTSLPGVFGDMVARGPLTAFTGIDIAARTGQNNMIFRRPQKELEGKYGKEYLLDTLLGPVGGLGSSFFDFLQMMHDGYTARATEKIAPKFIRDPLAAYRIYRHGVTSLRGDVISEINEFEAAAKALGFSDANTSMAYDINFTRQRVESEIKARRTHLLDLAARAKIDKDNEAYADAWKDIEHFNKAVPELRIVPAQIMKSVKQRIKTSGKMADGFLADRKLKKYTDKFNYTTTEE